MAKTVQALLEDIAQLGQTQFEIVQAVRALAMKTVRPLTEEVKYGGILFGSTVQFAGVFAYKAHVSVEFSHGARILDTDGHLEGNGKGRRHVKLQSVDDLKAKNLKNYLGLAHEAALDNAASPGTTKKP
ncbi:MAG: DUF1801 domain-containing protein [Burkholderiaceae bacterium]